MNHLKENLLILLLLIAICLGVVYSTEVINFLEGIGRGLGVLYNIKNIEPTEKKLAEDNRPVSVISSEEVVQQEDISPDSATNNTSNPAFSSVASWYDYDLPDYPNYSKDHLTCASRDYERGTILKVTNIDNQRWIKCRVNDYIEHPDRDIDLSSYAFEWLAPLSLGLLEVTIERVE